MTHRERVLARHPSAVCRRLKGHDGLNDGLNSYTVYSYSPSEYPFDPVYLGTGWTEHLAWKAAAKRVCPEYVR